MKESDLQKACARYLDFIGAIWCHVANERQTSPQRGAMLKAQGVKSGVPDILIFDKKKGFNGLAIELKVGYNKPKDNQRKWLNDLSDQNWKAVWTNNFDEFLSIVDEYFSIK